MNHPLDRSDPWVWAYLEQAETDAHNRELPIWLRVSQLAVARVRANGHAPFGPGKLPSLLRVDRRNLPRAINKAVQFGYLVDGSSPRCLLPHPSRYYVGKLKNRGSKYAVCDYHETAETEELARLLDTEATTTDLDQTSVVITSDDSCHQK
ncbi:hypothetical protein LH935_16465 [Gordonia polyisoprenivorans]|uniref:hypothetical protein n=1 Tax=Gordonia polyisoprenivorans TaxID=84595 RepID=UPI002234E6EB|nr:hypothetical protein LH935_16465 [Gordonia polyisoprenivorans]